MKNTKTKIKKWLFVLVFTVAITGVIYMGVSALIQITKEKALKIASVANCPAKLIEYIKKDQAQQGEANRAINEAKKEPAYIYNERIPTEEIKAEIVRQAELFGNDIEFMLKLADCESTFNNLADNPNSTAKGVYQFVALTWEETQSNTNKISEFDYKANIREANIKIANHEYHHWKGCLE